MRSVRGLALMVKRQVSTHWKTFVPTLLVYAAWVPVISWFLCNTGPTQLTWTPSLTGMFPNPSVVIITTFLSIVLTLMSLIIAPQAYTSAQSLIKRCFTPAGRQAAAVAQRAVKLSKEAENVRIAAILESAIRRDVEELAAARGVNVFEATLLAHEVLGLIEEKTVVE